MLLSGNCVADEPFVQLLGLVEQQESSPGVASANKQSKKARVIMTFGKTDRQKTNLC